MNMNVSSVGCPTTQVASSDPKDSNKSTELASSNVQSQNSNATLPQNNNGPQDSKYSLVKEARDWLNSVMWGLTLATGLYITYNSFHRYNFKEVTDALNNNDATTKEILKALGKNNEQTADLIKHNNESVMGAVSENTAHLREVIKVLDKDGDGKLSEAEIRETQMLMEEAKRWKRFTDALNEATKKK